MREGERGGEEDVSKGGEGREGRDVGTAAANLRSLHMCIMCALFLAFLLLFRVMDINLRAVLFLSQSVAKDMIERGDGGAIVNVSSQASQCALPEHTVYCT